MEELTEANEQLQFELANEKRYETGNQIDRIQWNLSLSEMNALMLHTYNHIRCTYTVLIISGCGPFRGGQNHWNKDVAGYP